MRVFFFSERAFYWKIYFYGVMSSYLRRLNDWLEIFPFTWKYLFLSWDYCSGFWYYFRFFWFGYLFFDGSLSSYGYLSRSDNVRRCRYVVYRFHLFKIGTSIFSYDNLDFGSWSISILISIDDDIREGFFYILEGFYRCRARIYANTQITIPVDIDMTFFYWTSSNNKALFKWYRKS